MAKWKCMECGNTWEADGKKAVKEGKPFQPYIKQLIREDMKKEKAQ